MEDRLVRAITADGMVKAAAVSTRVLTERAREIHRTLPVATAALGRTLAAASILGNALKDDGSSLTLQIRGGGPLGTLLAVSDNAGNVRGTVDHPEAELPLRPDGKLNVGAAVGTDGTLTVIRDLNMKEPYVGTVALLSGEIADDLASYLVESEQIPSACGLGVLVDRDQSVRAAGGYLIELMPGAGEDVIGKVEGGVLAAGSVTHLLDGNDDPERMLRALLSDFDLKILEETPVAYRCPCSRERMERALISLGPDELQSMLDQQGQAELGCRFCGRKQIFTGAELKAMLGKMNAEIEKKTERKG
ncbi:MAG: Hsp33 family molecular chaperone HslO [Oscillibacter sp.]|jgi:molecular chaperone Hsp33|nr:Hsp33 family molecular chaperone HslO [Oscillibacter sp.]